jgi:hypothetical protein
MLIKACQSIIGHMLYPKIQKLVIKEVFRVMDTSGDGQLGFDEIQDGYKKIFKFEDGQEIDAVTLE